ncbi:hypothetical protein GIB67_005883 [Kingdonia uniflora]|uniref:Disease resistance R13L4/SHOC-2-like LRR domain-containing protein n=1 Tax=Kingdonia uniflora TaxID=39325 RepID=A0A7J7MBI4_9MAGN|nr:hypothetical protein GIB67_005883 [Kingdonia uniflora]
MKLLLHHLTCLRTLDLAGVAIETLPNEVGSLIHLRYLDLSETNLVELPETVSNLRNLQTLKLTSCEKLRRLPEGLRKLVNLRHLELNYTYALECLPKGLQGLRDLQTLTRFVMSEEGCQLRELSNLNNLRGHLAIANIRGSGSKEFPFKIVTHQEPYQPQSYVHSVFTTFNTTTRLITTQGAPNFENSGLQFLNVYFRGIAASYLTSGIDYQWMFYLGTTLREQIMSSPTSSSSSSEEEYNWWEELSPEEKEMLRRLYGDLDEEETKEESSEEDTEYDTKDESTEDETVEEEGSDSDAESIGFNN